MPTRKKIIYSGNCSIFTIHNRLVFDTNVENLSHLFLLYFFYSVIFCFFCCLIIWPIMYTIKFNLIFEFYIWIQNNHDLWFFFVVFHGLVAWTLLLTSESLYVTYVIYVRFKVPFAHIKCNADKSWKANGKKITKHTHIRLMCCWAYTHHSYPYVLESEVMIHK